MPSSESKGSTKGIKSGGEHVRDVLLSHISKINWRVVAVGLCVAYFMGIMGMVFRAMFLLSLGVVFFAYSAAVVSSLIDSVLLYSDAYHRKETARDVLRVHLLGKGEFDVERLMDVSRDIHATRRIEEDVAKDIKCRKMLLRRSELESQHKRAMIDGVTGVAIYSLALLVGGLCAAIIYKSLLAAAIVVAIYALPLGIDLSAKVVRFMALRKREKAWDYNRMVREIVLESERSYTGEESKTRADEGTPVVATPTEKRTSPVGEVDSGKNDAYLDFDIRKLEASLFGRNTKEEGFGTIRAGAFGALETGIFTTAYRDINGFGYCRMGSEPSTQGFFVAEPFVVAQQQTA